VYRADDLAAIVDYLPGRWCFVTLTMRRDLFLSPETGYQRVKDRVREVCQVVASSGIYVNVKEPQTKTGGGWIHWHALCWAPDARPVEEIRRAVERCWRVRDGRVVRELVDQLTGEVRQVVEHPGFMEPIGRVDVQVAGSVKGTAKYVAKYISKRWAAVPPWMLESTTRFRKFSASSGFYDLLERVGRHSRVRGSRAAGSPMRRTPPRTLLERMARSGARSLVFRSLAGELQFAGVVPVPYTVAVHAVADRSRMVIRRYGDRVAAARWIVPAALVADLRARDSRADVEFDLEKSRCEIAGAWADLQGRLALDRDAAR